MSPNHNIDARAITADALADVEIAPLRPSAAPQPANRELQERLDTLATQQEQFAERFAGLEEAARAAIDAITMESEQRLAATADRAETRVVEGLTLIEQQQHEQARSRSDLEERLRTQMRELGEWDENLSEMRQEIGGLREMAEAALSIASGDLEQRWDALRRELRDTLATAESDERARWEAFMAGVSETLAVNSGIDPTALETVRTEVTTLRNTANQTINQIQGVQREQLAALRSEMRTLVESERSAIGADVDTRLEEARRVFLAQVQSLQDWQQQVGKDVQGLRGEASSARQEVNAATAQLNAETQRALAMIHNEVDQGVAQARSVAQSETGSIRIESERHIRAVQQQARTAQMIALVIAVLALLMGAGALALVFMK